MRVVACPSTGIEGSRRKIEETIAREERDLAWSKLKEFATVEEETIKDRVVYSEGIQLTLRERKKQREGSSPDNHPTFLSFLCFPLRASVTPSHTSNPFAESDENEHTRCNSDESKSQLLTLEHFLDPVHCQSDIDFDFLNLDQQGANQ